LFDFIKVGRIAIFGVVFAPPVLPKPSKPVFEEFKGIENTGILGSKTVFSI